jgi:hypothetical protein
VELCYGLPELPVDLRSKTTKGGEAMTFKSVHSQKILVFMSHIHEEALVATLLQQELSRILLNGIEFFVSSERECIRAGDEWLNKIRDALCQARVVIVLLSPRSVDRNWINFEAGAAWLMGNKCVVPLCHAGLRPSNLPQPLHSFSGLDLKDPHDLQELAGLIAKEAGLSLPHEDWARLSKLLGDASSSVRVKHLHPHRDCQIRLLPRCGDPKTRQMLYRSMSSAKQIGIFGIGLSFLWDSGFFARFEKRVLGGAVAARKCMAHFRSADILRRLKEEPAHPIGIGGSETLVRSLLEVEARVSDPNRFSLRLFDHYPTYATLQFDDEIYLYPYCFKSLGNAAPTFYWRGKDPAAQFFREQFEALWSHSQPAEQVYALDCANGVFEGFGEHP